MNKKNRSEVSEGNQKECPFSEDIIFQILTWLPAEFLHSRGRKVCREWAALINNPKFIECHSSRSPTVLLMQPRDSSVFFFLEVNKGNAVIKRESRDFSGGFSGRVVNACCGIILFSLSKDFQEEDLFLEENYSLAITNIVTEQSTKLPSIPLRPVDSIITAAIGYDHLCWEFKVMCLYKAGGQSYYWLFFTVGKDEAWRKVGLATSQIPIESFIGRKWISAGGVVYGVFRRSIIAVEVKDEFARSVNLPDVEEETSEEFFVEENKLTRVSLGLKETTLSLYRLDDFLQSTWVKIHKF